MVYCGKPFSGCVLCKEAKKKCDETRPRCRRCQKRGLACPGIPDRQGIIIRDLTEHIIQRMAPRAAKHQVPTVPHSASRPASGVRRDSVQSDHGQDEDEDDSTGLASDLPLLPKIEERAVDVFLTGLVSDQRKRGSHQTLYGLLVTLYPSTATRSALALTTGALALRTLASMEGSRSLTALAQEAYYTALWSVGDAVSSPDHATSDETLLAVLLCAIFEFFASSQANWSRHIQGAVAIVKRRGMDQFAKSQSLPLFRATRGRMITDAIQRGVDIPEFPAPKGWQSDQLNERVPGHGHASVRLPGLLARAKCLHCLEWDSRNVELVRGILADAFEVQMKQYEQAIHSPLELRPQSVVHSAAQLRFPLDEGDHWASYVGAVQDLEIWPGPIEVYKDIETAGLCNFDRVYQLLCCEVIIRCLKWLHPLDFTEQASYKTAVSRSQCLVDQISASVPFQLGHGERASPDAECIQESPASHRDGVVGRSALVWPLVAASQAAEIPELQRTWLCHRLRFVAARNNLDLNVIFRSYAAAMIRGGTTDDEEMEGEEGN